jgi:hypothetical protein
MAADGTPHVRYDHWLTQRSPTGENLNPPISPRRAEVYRALVEPD